MTQFEDVPAWILPETPVLKGVLPRALFMVCLLGLSGCAVSMAVQQPGKKDLSVLECGTPRPLVLAELGMPSSSRWVAKKRVDVFRFVQGYSPGARAGRALAHGTADFFTAGFWEVAATPGEAYFSGENLAYEVLYNDRDRVLKTRVITP
ncbi:MAG: hypothetical protein DVB28_001885 [Verrucomicrobia bacterium]|nr:MAG: hypothetical protein DVB28_001885 [Verrucomicrobiota bacterium]